MLARQGAHIAQIEAESVVASEAREVSDLESRLEMAKLELAEAQAIEEHRALSRIQRGTDYSRPDHLEQHMRELELKQRGVSQPIGSMGYKSEESNVLICNRATQKTKNELTILEEEAARRYGLI